MRGSRYGVMYTCSGAHTRTHAHTQTHTGNYKGGNRLSVEFSSRFSAHCYQFEYVNCACVAGADKVLVTSVKSE